jgi:methionyl-tRNA synthetase
MRDMVFGLDSDFSEEALIGRINADLANDLGNLVSRSLSMVHRYFKGKLPEPGPLSREDLTLKQETLGVIEPYRNHMDGFAFHRALMAVWEVIGSVNKYIDTMAPWELAKSDTGRLNTVIRCIIDPLRVISVLLWPFMPGSAEKIQDLLRLPKSGRDLGLQNISDWGEPSSEGSLAKSVHLFPRIEGDKKAPQKNGKAEKKKRNAVQATIGLDAFQKLDLRVGRITGAEAVPKADRLLKLTLDIGEERTVVAGIAQHYPAEELIGRQVVLLANLEPVKIRGVESQGMVLAVEDDQGIHLLRPDVETKPGSRVK